MVGRRLSKIIDFYKDNHDIAKFAGITLTANDLDYLIQQAHRAEHNAQDLDILDRELARTQKQNQRYKTTLEVVNPILKEAIESLDNNEKVNGLGYAIQIIDQSLKGAEPND